MPFGLNTRQQNAWFYDGDGMKLLNEFGQKFNLYGLVGGNTGTQMGGWFRKEIREPSDFQGLKFRIGGWAGKIIEKLGGVPQQIAGGDIYQALEKGTIDAAEWVGPHDDEKLGLNRVAKYYYYPGWWEGAAALHFFINTAKWSALPKSYQAMLTAAAGIANVEMTARYDARNPVALRKLLNSGVELRPFTEATMDACLRASNEVNAEAAAANADFKKIYEFDGQLPQCRIHLVAGGRIPLRQFHDPFAPPRLTRRAIFLERVHETAAIPHRSRRGLAATAVAKPAIAQSTPELKWRMTSSFPKSLDTLYGAAEVFAKAVAEATDNKFQIQVFAGRRNRAGPAGGRRGAARHSRNVPYRVLLLFRQGSDLCVRHRRARSASMRA